MPKSWHGQKNGGGESWISSCGWQTSYLAPTWTAFPVHVTIYVAAGPPRDIVICLFVCGCAHLCVCVHICVDYTSIHKQNVVGIRFSINVRICASVYLCVCVCAYLCIFAWVHKNVYETHWIAESIWLGKWNWFHFIVHPWTEGRSKLQSWIYLKYYFYNDHRS